MLKTYKLENKNFYLGQALACILLLLRIFRIEIHHSRLTGLNGVNGVTLALNQGSRLLLFCFLHRLILHL